MIESYIRTQREKKEILLMTHIVIGYPSLRGLLQDCTGDGRGGR